jgi:unsaturated rhamnogalacturonyl hydrolase
MHREWDCLAMLKVWKETHTTGKYLDYVIQWADTIINDNGESTSTNVETYNIDYIQLGKGTV